MRGRFAALAVLAAGGTALLAGGAGAHEGEGLDLDSLVAHVGERIPATVDGERKVYRAYLKCGKALAKVSAKGFPDDLKKLALVAKQAERSLAGDATLLDLLEHAIEEADAHLATLPAAAERRVDEVAEGKGRTKLVQSAVKARDAHLEGRSAGTLGDGKRRLKLFRKGALGFAKVDALADRLVDAQGGPLPESIPAEPGNIYTVIGTGNGGHNGDGRPARRSSLYWVEEVKFGPDGLLYILDWNNHMLRRREADGTLTRLCGEGIPGDSEGPALQTQLNHPSAVAFDGTGRVFIAAWHNHKVKVYDPNGGSPVVYTIAGGPAGNAGDGGPATKALFNLLPGVLLLPEGHPLGGGDLLATDATNQCVRVVKLASDPVVDENVAGVTVATGTVERIFGTGVQGHDGDGGQASAARLGFSKAQNAESDGRMTMDAAGNIYLVNGVEHVVRRIAPDGTITTVAGNGTAGFSGDGGPATAASLDFPGDVAVASDGTLYISDQNNHCVRRVSPGGTISTFAGVPGAAGYAGDEGPAGQALLHRPTGLELDGNGNLYICDKDNSVVRVVAAAAPGELSIPRAPFNLPGVAAGVPPAKGPSGSIDTYAGTGVAAYSGDGKPARETDFYWPQNIAVEPASGLLYIVDWNNHRIRRVEDDGTVSTVAGVGELGDTNGPALEVRFNHPTDVAFSPLDGDLYIAAWHTDRVKRLHFSDYTISAVNRPDGKRTFSGDGGPVSEAELNLPSGVEFDSSGNLYIGDDGNRRVRRVDAITGIITTIAGTGVAGFSGDGGPATEATLNLPVGQSAQPSGRVCVDPTDSFLYLSDTDNHRIRRIDLETGIIVTVAGNGEVGYSGDAGPATEASLSSPVDVDCDAAGNLYICDRDNHAVRKVDLVSGVITTVAGDGTPGYTGDGGDATSARLQVPCGIFVHRPTGRLFIADTFNSVIRVVWE